VLWPKQTGIGSEHNSDRSVQYASSDFQELLTEFEMTCNMSRKGDCWDNAVAELLPNAQDRARVPC
jgi:transposase InsO family protein